MANMASVLDKAPGEVEPPRQIPVGSYRAIVKGLPRFDKSKVQGTDFAEYTVVLQEAYDDVDPDALDTALTKVSGEKVPLNSKTLRLTYYLTEDSAYRLKDFIKHCGVDIDEFKTMGDACQSLNNCSVGVHIVHTASQDGTRMYTNVDKTFSIE